METMNYAAIPTPRGPEEKEDLGFGAVVSTASRKRLLNHDGTFNVRRVGLPWSEAVSLYHSALTLRWPAFFGWVVLIYLGINVLFAVLFLVCGEAAIAGPDPSTMGGTFGRAFFFSVETFATIGYGNISPTGTPALILMTGEALVGVLAQALITGLFFARFARPTADINFSRRAVIAPFRDGKALMIRMANRRKNELMELKASLSFSFMDESGPVPLRRYRPLTLDRAEVTFFPLAWTIVHPITPASPLWGLDAAALLARDTEILLLLTGTDDTFATIVHARTSYKADEIDWDRRFNNIFNPPGADGVMSLDISRLDETQPVA
ncbi:MAG: ion channel [Gemmatimonadaceae bacterium]